MKLAFATAAVLFGAAQANAVTITDGFTFAVASDGGGAVGTHFHSSTGGDFGNPAGKAEVGSFNTEEVRGLSEYDLAGLGAAASAFVTFEVDDDAGLFVGTNDFPYVGGFVVDAYEGNNLEDVSDFEAPSTGAVGTFDSSGILVDDTLSFDITSIFNDAITNGDVSLGIRIAISDAPNGGAWVFDGFRLTTDDESTRPPSEVVPLPAALPLLFAGLGAVAALRVRRGA